MLIREQLVRRARDFHIVVMDVSIVSALHREDFSCNGGCVHYIIESKVQWKPFWLPLSSIHGMTGWVAIARMLSRMRTAPIDKTE